MLLVAYGTRPEYVKLKPLLPLLRERVPHRVLFTGQHDMLAGEPYDAALEIPDHGNRLDAIVSATLGAPDAVFDGMRAVLVQGDTASAFGLTLAAFHRGLAVYHLEAGLRTGNLAHPFPEELYRQQISRIASLHLCPTTRNRENLEAERCPGRKEVVGNTVLDNLLGLEARYDGPVLMSLHRRENQARAEEWLHAFDALAAAHPDQRFVFIRHPNPASRHLSGAMRHVAFIDPLPYDAMIAELAACRLIITDSGGFQEEGSFLGKRLIVCRQATERPECLGVHSVLCPSPEQLPALFSQANADPIVNAPCPFGDGRSAPRVVRLLEEMLAH
ncbi:MAG TPA: UDP-N-acetylglucosamine 2-epimerase [Gemmatimonadaceae bacterium]|nr:UDP-N-acetylglucosamine 2-epimerase [Gemmatimonadaceae bacterium]